MAKKEPKPKEGKDVCKGCWTYKAFGGKCFYYWDKKKTCTHFRKNEFSLEEFKTIL